MSLKKLSIQNMNTGKMHLSISIKYFHMFQNWYNKHLQPFIPTNLATWNTYICKKQNTIKFASNIKNKYLALRKSFSFNLHLFRCNMKIWPSKTEVWAKEFTANPYSCFIHQQHIIIHILKYYKKYIILYKNQQPMIKLKNM